MVVHLPEFGSQCEEPCGNYKIKSDVLETPVILMPDLWDLRQRRMTRRMTIPCGRGRVAISTGSVLPHQEINGGLDYDRMERCQVWQEIPQMPAL